MSPEFHGAMIAGTHSSSGKTTWVLALIALLQKKSLIVQPFKSGPDYIDTSFHHVLAALPHDKCGSGCMCRIHRDPAAPRKSRNLDLFLMNEEQNRAIFQANAQGADVSLVEGMMGLFDGKTATGLEGSSAQIAKLLGLPVFLVMDGKGMASSAAAIVLGFQKFDPEVRIAGIFLNRVNSERHFNWLKQAIESRTGVPCLGWLPEVEELKIPERHLGLTTAAESKDKLKNFQYAAQLLEERLDWEKFLAASTTPRPGSLLQRGRENVKSDARIAIAYDKAFSFYYEDNFDLLRAEGAELVFFSPLEDTAVPENCDLLYFGGGFPEIYAAKLSSNRPMAESVRGFYKSGGAIYAECGGFIYLTEAFISKETEYPLVGLISGKISMQDRLQHFGYHELKAAADTFLFSKGEKLRSHEFHYSRWEAGENKAPAYLIGERSDGYAADRLLASYQHLHFGSNPLLAKKMVEQCLKHPQNS